PYWGPAQLAGISLEAGELSIFISASYICYNSSNTTETSGESWFCNMAAPFMFSPTQNVFTVIGCNTLAFLNGGLDASYRTGCISTCDSMDAAAQDGDDCTGLGCCQTPILKNLGAILVDWNDTNFNTPVDNPAWNYIPCSYAFVAQKDWYQFRRQDLIRNGTESFLTRGGERMPVVLDWAISSNGSCGEAGIAPACVSAHSYCVNPYKGMGICAIAPRGTWAIHTSWTDAQH
ncbi:hypothetical protein EJB05_26942, partial [Eragrostis curvula]